MRADADLDAMTEACIEAARLVRLHGSPDLQAAMRVVLFILGGEAAKRQEREGAPEGGATNGTSEDC